MPAQIITQKRLKELLDYNAVTGEFTWLVTKGKAKAGTVAGWLENGYLRIGIAGKTYQAQRLAWLNKHGAFPKNQLDHINHIRDDNRIANLREVTQAENQKNVSKRSDNTSGFTGVCWYKRHSNWRVQITVNGKIIHLGYFSDIDDAITARKSANIKYTYHANHGSQAVTAATFSLLSAP